MDKCNFNFNRGARDLCNQTECAHIKKYCIIINKYDVDNVLYLKLYNAITTQIMLHIVGISDIYYMPFMYCSQITDNIYYDKFNYTIPRWINLYLVWHYLGGAAIDIISIVGKYIVDDYLFII
jgi:hypothetical protein